MKTNVNLSEVIQPIRAKQGGFAGKELGLGTAPDTNLILLRKPKEVQLKYAHSFLWVKRSMKASDGHHYLLPLSINH